MLERFESELKALESKKTAAAQNLAALTETQAEMQTRVAELLVELKTAEGKVAEAEDRARQVLADGERRAFGLVNSASKDADALRERLRAAIAKAQAAFEGLS
jgi:chromosome segregation ATPase